MERKVAHQIVKERALRGVFKTLEDFISRLDIVQEQLDILVRIGALRFTGFNKYELMWEKNAVYNPKNRLTGTEQLFSDGFESFELPQLREEEFDQAFDEIELLGFPLRSPFELIDGKCEGDILARQMNDFVGKRVMILGYYVTKKNVTTVNKRLMNFGTWVDKEGRFFDTTHFPPSLKRSPFRGKGCYLIKGIVVLDFDFPSIEVSEMKKLPIVKDGRY
jgi:DNA polymerase-3 subunit alpha